MSGRKKGGRPRRTEPYETVSVTMPTALVEEVDEAAGIDGESRSGWVEGACRGRLETRDDVAPRGLFQDQLREEPFWMLVACILVNRKKYAQPSAWVQVEPVYRTVRGTWVDPWMLGRANPELLQEVLEPLGIVERRAENIRNLARLWTSSAVHYTAEDVELLPGCGKYAADSWAIFVEGRLDRKPTDKKLRERWEALRG